MSEDDVKKIVASGSASELTPVPTTCVIQLVAEIPTVLKPGIKLLLTPEVPGAHWPSLLLAPTRAGGV